MDLVVINTGGVLDSVEFVEFSLHQLIDGFDFCVRREPLSYYDVIMIHRKFQVVSTGQILVHAEPLLEGLKERNMIGIDGELLSRLLLASVALVTQRNVS